MKCHQLEDIMSIYKDYDVIAIDEGQFFGDIEKCDMFANNGKTVIVAALDATFQRKPFGKVLELIPLAEKISKLSAVCVVCNSDAFFSQRIVEDSTIELIGGGESYRAVCRKCFYSDKKKEKSTTMSPTTSFMKSPTVEALNTPPTKLFDKMSFDST